MSTGKLDRITAIASRQPALNPARHHVSPAVLEHRIVELEAERAELIEALQGTLWVLEGGNYSKSILEQLHFARALLARIKGG